MTTQTIKVPNLLNMMKGFNLKVNPNYEKFLEISDEFIKKFGGAYAKRFLAEDRPLLYALTCPTAGVDGLRLHADLNDCVWFADELVDENPVLAVVYGKKLLKVLENPDDEVDFLIGEALKDIINRIKSSTTEEYYEKLIGDLTIMLHAHAREAKQKEENATLNIEDFMRERVINSGSHYFLTISKIAEGIKFSDELLKNEHFKNLEIAYLKAVWIINDIYSFAREYSLGTIHSNFIWVLKNEKKISYQEAFDEAEKIYQELIDSFEETEKNLLRDLNSPETKQAIEFIKSNLIGQVQWTIVSRRYAIDENFEETHLIKIKC